MPLEGLVLTAVRLLEGLCDLRRGMVLAAVIMLMDGLAVWVLIGPQWL